MAFDWDKLARDADASRARLETLAEESRKRTAAEYEKHAAWLARIAENRLERGDLDGAAEADAEAIEFFNKAANAA